MLKKFGLQSYPNQVLWSRRPCRSKGNLNYLRREDGIWKENQLLICTSCFGLFAICRADTTNCATFDPKFYSAFIFGFPQSLFAAHAFREAKCFLCFRFIPLPILQNSAWRLWLWYYCFKVVHYVFVKKSLLFLLFLALSHQLSI